MNQADFINKKLIAFDLDETLAESKAEMTAEMANLLAKLTQVKKVAIISGGSFGQFERQFFGSLSRAANINYDSLVILPTSGAVFYEYKNGEWQIVYSEDLTEEEKAKTMLAFEKGLADINYKRPKEVFGQVIEDRGTQITFSALGQKAPVGLKQAWDPDRSKRTQIKEAIEKYIPELEVRTGGSTSVDVTKKGIDKAFGMKKILEHFNLEKEDILFIGDAMKPGGNDYPVKAFGIDSIEVSGPTETADIINNLLKKAPNSR